LERLRDKLNENPDWEVTLTVSKAKQRAILRKLFDKTTDKKHSPIVT
jgi:hypothetical protein